MTVRVTKDSLNDVLQQIRAMAQSQVLVGFPESTAARKDGEIDNPNLAYIHDQGAPAANIPQREFMRPGVESVRDQIVTVFEKGVKAALDGDKGAAATALAQAGAVAQGGIQQKIADGPFAPLEPETIARKKSSKPLIDTGAMRQAVTWVVRPKGS